MKIGLVSPYDYSFPGGVVNHISYLAHYFIQWGHEVKIIAPCLRKGTQYFEEEVTAVGRPFPIPASGSVARVPLSPWLPTQVGKILDKEEFDILHLHEPFTPMLSLSALLRSKSINVGTFHACHSKPRGYWIGKPILKKWLPRLHGKIAVSKPALDFVSRHLPGDYRIIPNGIDTERFFPDGPQREEFADNKLNMLFVGRLEKRKGLDYLLRACAKVKTQFSNLRLIVVGPGTRLRPKYEKLIEDVKLVDVISTGFVSNTEMPTYYRSADIFCAPATGGESFGIVLLEAMASGKPVVATDIEGYASLLTHGEEGLLVPPRDEEALARALLSLLNDESLRHWMGAKGRIKAEKYSWANVAQQVMDYYTSLLS
ncbi:MAG TPA: glycosyltransferase family 4 protein [Dehalococcoidia bacterium]|nr:glycosyltransferase family 4 protein [Dehalococcoidia bacterium]